MANKFSLTKGRPVFIIDLSLIPIFILVIYSGLKLHVAGHGIDHDKWEFWAGCHTITCQISLILIWFHVKAHWGWYKGLIKNGLANKSKITAGITILFLALTITGFLLTFFINGPNSSIGLWHYKLGLITSILIIIHTIKRFPIMMKGIRRKKKSCAEMAEKAA